MTRQFILLVAATSLVWNAPSSAQKPSAPLADRQDICGIKGASVADIFRSVTSDKAIVFHENVGEYQTYIDEENRRFWTFTRHAAKRPTSVICRTIIPKGKGSEIRLEIRCDGATVECESLRDEWKDFQDAQLAHVQS